MNNKTNLGEYLTNRLFDEYERNGFGIKNIEEIEDEELIDDDEWDDDWYCYDHEKGEYIDCYWLIDDEE